MERKAKAATETGALLFIIAGILVAVNALSALGGYKRIDTTKNERYTLSKGSANLLHSMKQDMRVDAYVTKGLPKLDVFVRDLRDLLQEYKAAGRDEVRLHDHRSEGRGSEEGGQGRRPGRAALRRGERHRRQGGRDPGLHGHGASSTARRRTASSSSRRSAPTASSSGSPTRSARSPTRGTTSTTRSASSPVTTR